MFHQVESFSIKHNIKEIIYQVILNKINHFLHCNMFQIKLNLMELQHTNNNILINICSILLSYKFINKLNIVLFKVDLHIMININLIKYKVNNMINKIYLLLKILHL